jgi:hypothetical protein
MGSVVVERVIIEGWDSVSKLRGEYPIESEDERSWLWEIKAIASVRLEGENVLGESGGLCWQN